MNCGDRGNKMRVLLNLGTHAPWPYERVGIENGWNKRVPAPTKYL